MHSAPAKVSILTCVQCDKSTVASGGDADDAESVRTGDARASTAAKKVDAETRSVK
jgi:hypothetical protein